MTYNTIKAISLSTAFLIVFAMTAVKAKGQASEGPTNFVGTNTSQIVSVQQDGTGNIMTGLVNGTQVFTVSPSGGVGSVGPLAGVLGWDTSTTETFGTVGVIGASSSTVAHSSGVEAVSFATTGAVDGILVRVGSPQGTAAFLNISSAGGNLIVGTTGGFPGTPVFRVDNEGTVFADGGFRPHGADFAEAVAVAKGRSRYEPGDLLIVDKTTDRQLTLSTESYSALVAGIYSTKPGVLASPFEIDEPIGRREIPLAVMGIVPCKVSAENGSIKRGDLLVTSSTPGYAMKGTDRRRMLGAVVGKALQPLETGKGVIEVLIALQ